MTHRYKFKDRPCILLQHIEPLAFFDLLLITSRSPETVVWFVLPASPSPQTFTCFLTSNKSHVYIFLGMLLTLVKPYMFIQSIGLYVSFFFLRGPLCFVSHARLMINWSVPVVPRLLKRFDLGSSSGIYCPCSNRLKFIRSLNFVRWANMASEH